MHIEQSIIPDILIITPQAYGDERGYFMETYRLELFTKAGIPYTFVQDNHSGSKCGTLRGLHYQINQPQGKLIRAVLGEVYDVAVDMRRKSPTFGKWVGMVLSASNRLQLWVPPGFAHGFYVLSEWAEIVYKATDYYAPEWERTLYWNDPEIAISWPILKDQELLVSSKDRIGKLLKEAEVYDW
jgi:dTDP-4-dehydrorhamnose 3,5-epimerase